MVKPLIQFRFFYSILLFTRHSKVDFRTMRSYMHHGAGALSFLRLSRRGPAFPVDRTKPGDFAMELQRASQFPYSECDLTPR